jgi:hypothetical protein
MIFLVLSNESVVRNGILLALPLNEYLNAIIIIQLSITLPLLAAWHTSFACPKEVSRKRHPLIPALRAPLCCSPVAGRQKLADAQTGLASYSATSSAARRHQTGGSQYARCSFRYAFSGTTPKTQFLGLRPDGYSGTTLMAPLSADEAR